MRVSIAATIAVVAVLGKAQGHEFFIDPLDYAVGAGNLIAADLRVGQDFTGAPYSYLPQYFTRFEVWSGDAGLPVERRLGDLPALVMEDLPEGLAIVVHETTDTPLTYTEWDRFVAFAEHKDFGDIAALHDGRDLPRTGFVETYSRHAKSLIAIGDGAGRDREFGLEIEIVALANPYTENLDTLPVQVFFRGEALADVQVELFERAPDETVTITLHRTDAEGIAQLPVQPGHEYMADHVVLEAVDPTADNPAVWHTYWANLTFAVPG